jgi:HPt (histidine-containing phosphotransfer) domain-containing protein
MIEAHKMKGTLANIGAMELSAKAQELETASSKKDTDSCRAKLPSFLEELVNFGRNLAEALAEREQHCGPIVLPPELPPIFQKLTNAFAKTDFAAIDEGMESLSALNPDKVLQEELDKIKDAVLTMDYKSALEIMQSLVQASLLQTRLLKQN